jgi:hypothetical protein
MLDAGTLAITPDPYGLLNFGRSRPTLTDAERSDRRTPTLLFLRIGGERRVQTLLMPPNAVDDLDSASGRVSTMHDYKQIPKVGRIPHARCQTVRVIAGSLAGRLGKPTSRQNRIPAVRHHRGAQRALLPARIAGQVRTRREPSCSGQSGSARWCRSAWNETT